jgi:hypothetical protein
MAAVLIILVGLAYFLSSNNASAPTGSPTPTTQVFIWKDTSAVKALDIVSGTEKVELVKDSATGDWNITQPVSQPADVFQVGNASDSLQNLQAQYALSGTTDLSEYGLASPPLQVTVTFSNTSSSTRVLEVGAPTTDGAGYYVKLPDSNQVYLVSNTTIEPLKSWLTNPPIQQPTATPVPITPVTDTPTPTVTPTLAPGATTGEATATSTPLASTSPSPSP